MTTITPYRPAVPAGRDSFAHLLHAEWTKLRAVRGWMVAVVVAALVTVLLGLLVAAGKQTTCGKSGVDVACPAVPVGPDGEAVNDKFYFVHQPLTGDGSITARLTSLTGIITYPPPNHDEIVPGVVAWAKAGVMIKESGRQGSAYAAMMLTGSHGVRMQDNFTHDTAGRPGGVSAHSPRWLRLTRFGDTIAGYESADGTQWTRVATVVLKGLPATVQVGLFVTSPCDLTVERQFGQTDDRCRFTEATGVFDQVSLQGGTAGGGWSHDHVGIDDPDHHPGRVEESGGTFTVTGSGDVAPSADAGAPIESTLIGMFAGLVVVIVVAVLFITAEYRRGLIRTTLAASPRRGRVLAAKAIAVVATAFVAGLFTVTAVFALALGALLRRSVVAVTAAIVTIVLPYVLATTSVLPVDAARWLLRLTPAAGFAIQQTIPEYPQVIAQLHAGQWDTTHRGDLPISPWAGLAVLAAWATTALLTGGLLLQLRDA